MKRIYGYLKKQPDAAIRFRTGIPDNESMFEVPEHEWIYSVHGDSSNIDLGYDVYPKPLGNPVRISTFEDANLGYCKITRKSITGVLYLVNQIPVQ